MNISAIRSVAVSCLLLSRPALYAQELRHDWVKVTAAAGWQPRVQAQPKGRLQMYLARRIDVLAICAAFAFVGAILLGMI